MKTNNVKKTGRGFKFLVALAMLILFSNFALAISGSGGGIKVSGTLDSIGYTTNDLTTLNYGDGGSSIIGTFDSQNITGGFGGLNITLPNDTFAPVITLLSPLNNSGTTNSNVTFSYNVLDGSEISNCTLYVDNVQNMISIIPNNGDNSFNLNNVNASLHTWKLNCQDVYGNSATTNVFEFSVVKISNFDSTSTNLSNVDIRNVTNFTLQKQSIGGIVFSGSTDLSNGADLNNFVKIEHNKIFLNSSAVSFLNKPATLTLRNVEYQNVVIWRDGVVCNDCSIKSFNSGTLVFDVTGFSTYTITSTTILNVHDDTDSITKYNNENITFYANYNNITSSASIAGTCNIAFDIGGWTAPSVMSYDGNIYTFNRSFDNVGIFNYNISCTPTPPGFDALSTIDQVYINNVSAGSLAKVNGSVVQTSRFVEDNTAKTVNSESGNMTQMIIKSFSPTDAWQGYYGNVSAKISLLDGNGTAFYDWSGINTNGEVFASRNPSILWDSVNCTNSLGITNEDNYLGKTALEADSVVNTFNETTHPTLNVLSKQLSNCPSRKLNGPSGTPDNNFWNVLISDNYGEGNMIYTGILKSDSLGFTGKIYDFELIVGAKNYQVETYYFYMEIG